MRKANACLALAALVLASTSALARGPWRANEGNTSGWFLMSPDERIDHQARIRGFQTYDECRAYQAEHHRSMESRAAAKGLALAPGGRDFCAHLRPGAEGR